MAERCAAMIVAVLEVLVGPTAPEPTDAPLEVRELADAALFCVVPGKYRVPNAQARWEEFEEHWGTANSDDAFVHWLDLFAADATFFDGTYDAETMKARVWGGAAFGPATDSYLLAGPTFEQTGPDYKTPGFEASTLTDGCRRRAQVGMGRLRKWPE